MSEWLREQDPLLKLADDCPLFEWFAERRRPNLWAGVIAENFPTITMVASYLIFVHEVPIPLSLLLLSTMLLWAFLSVRNAPPDRLIRWMAVRESNLYELYLTGIGGAEVVRICYKEFQEIHLRRFAGILPAAAAIATYELATSSSTISRMMVIFIPVVLLVFLMFLPGVASFWANHNVESLVRKWEGVGTSIPNSALRVGYSVPLGCVGAIAAATVTGIFVLWLASIGFYAPLVIVVFLLPGLIVAGIVGFLLLVRRKHKEAIEAFPWLEYRASAAFLEFNRRG